MAEDENTKNAIWQLKVDQAVIKKDVEQTNKELANVKEELKSLKEWISRGVWVIAGGVLLQLTRFILEGGLSGIVK